MPIQTTNFAFPQQEKFYRGKVRDVYTLANHLVLIATDRISTFDVVLPVAIPHKGQVLNQLSVFFMALTASKVPNWLLASPDPNVAIGLKCEPLPIEMVIRGHLAGTAWRAYKSGQRVFNGYTLPEGLRENDALPQPIITPSTKAVQGQHDEDISSTEIVAQGLVSANILQQAIDYTQELFAQGRHIAHEVGLILVDTKYEFGMHEGKLYLIDEIHTPDSARYFNLEGFEERQDKGEAQPQRSKEMLRQWLIKNGFQGREGEQIPTLSVELIGEISAEYISIYEQITGQKFVPILADDRLSMLENNINSYLKKS